MEWSYENDKIAKEKITALTNSPNENSRYSYTQGVLMYNG